MAVGAVSAGATQEPAAYPLPPGRLTFPDAAAGRIRLRPSDRKNNQTANIPFHSIAKHQRSRNAKQQQQQQQQHQPPGRCSIAI